MAKRYPIKTDGTNLKYNDGTGEATFILEEADISDLGSYLETE